LIAGATNTACFLIAIIPAAMGTNGASLQPLLQLTEAIGQLTALI